MNEWRKELASHWLQIILALVFLTVASFVNYYAGNYVTNTAQVMPVPDLILDHIPYVNMGFFYVWLYLAVFFVFFLYPLLYKPHEFHYLVGMVSLFVLIRAVFVTFTHIGTPPRAIVPHFPWGLNKLNFNNDLFFSGHTGLPFLGYLVFRRDSRFVKWFMLAAAVVLGVTVLLMHEHYSIDVLAAFFITYTIYVIGGKLFNGTGKAATCD